MNYIIKKLFFIGCFINFCIAYAINPDTSKLTKHEARLNAIEKRQLEILSQDSLKKKIEGYEARLKNYETNQTYFQTALSSQTTIFSLIVAGLLSLVAIVTFRRITHDIKLNKDYIDEKERVLKEDFKVHITKMEDMEKSIARQKRNAAVAMANTYSIVAFDQKEKELWDQVYLMHMRAINCHINACDEDSLKENIEAFRNTILSAIRALSIIKTKGILMEENDKKEIQETLQELIKIDKPIIIEPAAELYSKSISTLKYKKEETKA